MGKDHPEIPESRKDGNRVKIVASALAIAVLFLAEIFLMTDEFRNYIAIGVTSVLILFAVYILVISLLSDAQRKAVRREEQYDKVYKSGKATYVRLRKSFAELEYRIQKMENVLESPKDEIISAQKALAKLTINRTKENTDALLNSNDKLIDKLFEIETQINSGGSQISEMDNQELMNTMKTLESAIDQIQRAIAENSAAIAKVSTAQSAPAVSPEPVVTPELSAGAATEPEVGESIGAFSFEETASEPEVGESIGAFSFEETASEPEVGESIGAFSFEETASEPEVGESIGAFSFEEEVSDVATDINELGFDEEPAVEPAVSEPAAEMAESVDDGFDTIGLEELPEETSEAVISASSLEEPTDPNEMSLDEIASVASIADDVLNDSNLNDEPGLEPVVEAAESKPEPVVEAAESKPEPAASNKVMSPDEIAALIANTTASATPVVEEPKAETPPPSMDALSDPNKVMSPDEIAALIANI